MTNGLLICFSLLLLALDAQAMDVSLRIMEGEHSTVNHYKHKNFSDLDAGIIRMIAELRISDEGNENSFFHPTQERADYKVLYAKQNGELNVFAIEAKAIFDRGNKTEVRIAWEILQREGSINRFYGDRVIVKEMPKNIDSQTKADFDVEIDILKHMGYFKGLIEDEKKYYLFMRHVEGKNLEAMLRDENLSDDEKSEIALNVIWSVHILHQEFGILHNDLKSGNIMINRIDGKWFAGIVDFGHACRVNDPRMGMLGSSGYRDYYRCGKDACLTSIQSDYFSLGIIIFEIMSSAKNNYQRHIVKMKINSYSGEWDIGEQEDLEEAFAEFFVPKSSAVKNGLAAKLIPLAKIFTGINHHRIPPRALTGWLMSASPDIKDFYVKRGFDFRGDDEKYFLKQRIKDAPADAPIKSAQSFARWPFKKDKAGSLLTSSGTPPLSPKISPKVSPKLSPSRNANSLPGDQATASTAIVPRRRGTMPNETAKTPPLELPTQAPTKTLSISPRAFKKKSSRDELRNEIKKESNSDLKKTDSKSRRKDKDKDKK